jgi:glycosyltransferase involved in cell wall biosynthesis
MQNACLHHYGPGLLMRLAPLRPLRVLFLNDTARNGGPGRSLHTILRNLDPAEIYRAVVLPRPGVVSDLLESACETLVYLPEFVENPFEPYSRALRREDLDAPAPLRALRASRNVLKMGRSLTALSRLVRRGDFDLIYCNGTSADFAGATVGLMTGTPVLWHVRYTHVPDVARTLHAGLAAGTTVRRIICVSNAAARLFEHCPNKVVVIHNSVDVSAFSRDSVPPGTLRDELSLGERAFIFGAHGRVLPRKGFIEMLHAAREAFDAMTEAERSRARFVVVGDTPEDIGSDHVVECKEAARQLGIGDRVAFLGFRQDVRPYVRDFDVEIVPSVYDDPLPRAVIEAMSLGVPVIGTDVGGIGELLADGGGTLVPARDTHALCVAMLAYMRAPALRTEHGMRGRERAVAELAAPAHARRIRDEIARAVFG